MLNVSLNMARDVVEMTHSEYRQVTVDSLVEVRKIVLAEIHKKHSTTDSLFYAICDTILQEGLIYKKHTLPIEVDKDGYMYALGSKLKSALGRKYEDKKQDCTQRNESPKVTDHNLKQSVKVIRKIKTTYSELYNFVRIPFFS